VWGARGVVVDCAQEVNGLGGGGQAAPRIALQPQALALVQKEKPAAFSHAAALASDDGAPLAHGGGGQLRDLLRLVSKLDGILSQVGGKRAGKHWVRVPRAETNKR
jgi:hypothetical protein